MVDLIWKDGEKRFRLLDDTVYEPETDPAYQREWAAASADKANKALRRRVAWLTEENKTLREVRDLFAKGPDALEKAVLARIRRELSDFLARLTIRETSVAQYLRNPGRLPAAMDQRDIDDLLDRICPEEK